MTENAIVPVEEIPALIVVIRGQRVILDADLAKLYGTTTKRLNEQVKRNQERFPPDFVLRLDDNDMKRLRSQFATSNDSRGGRRYQPYAFTEHGALMAASVLNTPRAVEVSVYVVRAFVRLRQILSGHAELAQKLEELEKRLEARLDKHDVRIAALIAAIKELMKPLEESERRIGFRQVNGKHIRGRIDEIEI